MISKHYTYFKMSIELVFKLKELQIHVSLSMLLVIFIDVVLCPFTCIFPLKHL